MLIAALFEDAHVQTTGKARVIEWTSPFRSTNTDYEVVWVDVAALDASWRKDRDMYVGAGGAGGIRRRYAAFGEWLEGGEAVQMPIVGWNAHYQRAQFGNGRHRFRWMADHGAKALPVMVDVDTAEEFRERFGTSLRRTVIAI